MSYTYDWCSEPDCGAPIEKWSYTWKHRDYALDAKHKPKPQEPVEALDEGLYSRATRYAEALATSAVAQQRIDALVELVGIHEWHRAQAESALSAVQADEQFGTIWQPTGPEPEGVQALLCLVTGDVWRTDEHGHDWIHADLDARGQIRYQWPIPDRGPFIGWNDDYGFGQVIDKTKRLDTEHNDLHRMLYSEPGYRAEGEGAFSGRPKLTEATGRVLSARTHKWSEENQGRLVAERRLRRLRSAIEMLAADGTVQLPANQDSDDELRDVSVIDLDKVQALLDRPEYGGAEA